MSAGVRQPWLGVIGAIVAIGGSMLFVSHVSVLVLATWLTLGVTAGIPLQLLVAVMWDHAWPAPIARLAQPARGLAYTALFAAFALAVSWLTVRLIGGGITPPGPVPIVFIIYAVQIAIWVMVGFGGWPASLIRSPLGRSAATLALVYAVTFALFRLLFNFSHLQHTPLYVPALDPRGAFVAWGPVSFTMATVGVLLTLLYFDMQPISTLARRYPALGRQPLFGLASLAFAAAVGGGVWYAGTQVLGVGLVVFLAWVDVAYVFGVLMVINLFQMGAFVTLPQPWRGLVLTVATVVLAAVVTPLFRAVSTLAFGPLASGPPGYDFELWVASALLGITFPFMTLYSGPFEFWPFGPRRASPPA